MIVPVVAPLSSGARRWRYGFLVLLSLGCIGAALLYAINPSGTASSDSRARVLGYETFRTASTSMAPALLPGDLILVSTWQYRSAGPRAGDVIVYFPSRTSGAPWVARVAAVGGGAVEIRAGVVYVNQAEIREPHVDRSGLQRPESREFGTIVVPDGELFVLGDNRDNALDSRHQGPVSSDAVVGRVTAIWYSPDAQRIGWLR